MTYLDANPMNYTKKCQCENTDYTITRWTIQFDYKYKIECTCGSFIQLATQKTLLCTMNDTIRVWSLKWARSGQEGNPFGRKPNRFSGVFMIDEDDDQKNAPPPINRFSGTISFSRRKMQSRNLEQVRKMSVDKRPKRPKKNPSKESRLKGMLKKRRG